MIKTESGADQNILSAIGNTPLIKLRHIPEKGCADIYLKLEYLNPTGSYKDRMALAMISEAERKGELKQGMTVVECTAGGTGTSLALVCSAKGYRFKVVSSDAFAPEKLKMIALFGAELELLKSENGQITPDLIPRMIGMVKELGEDKENFWTHQFENEDQLVGYKAMGQEILAVQKNVDAFVSAVGTGGMFVGVSAVLKEANPHLRRIILEPASAPLISKGLKGSHKVDGIGVGFIPPLLHDDTYDEVLAVDERDARAMAKRLASEEGVMAGTSTGLNVVAALKIASELGPGKAVVTVACDHGMKYLSAGLF
ncbi:MAG TPA: cysteine synthase family protein [Chryseolinea sp.]